MVSIGTPDSANRVASKVPQPVRGLRPSPDMIFKRLGDEMVLFHLRTDRFYELNETAARFWELLCAGCDSVQIRERMLEEFAVDADQLAGEAEALLASLRQEDLITVDE
jgi:hypothetical protein